MPTGGSHEVRIRISETGIAWPVPVLLYYQVTLL